MPTAHHFDTIIVGGRPAGATLAARLGQQGFRVLLLERVKFPCPHPASSPVIYSSAMRLLDEVGGDENAYACNTPRIYRWVNEFYDQFCTSIPVPAAFGRDYGYALDRARFDEALWHNAARWPTVTARQPFTVTDVLWDANRVVGVQGHSPGQPAETFTADCVVGADGRFSTVARKVKAGICSSRTDLPTTVYYAGWRLAQPYDDHGPVVHFCQPGKGYFFFLFDSADGVLNVSVEGQSALLTSWAGHGEAVYMKLVRQHPLIWRRLAHAERVTRVHGMRNIGNVYRVASGPGWVLVGDALHQKDPIDGQGIYDALFEAKALAQAITAWKHGEQSYEQAMTAYEMAARAETYPMYMETLRQVKRTVFSRSPLWLDKLLFRCIGSDTELNHRYALLTVRALAPAEFFSPALLFRAALRGLRMRHFRGAGVLPASNRRDRDIAEFPRHTPPATD
ncbi:NAD(P)/FAD-dependent oxidoreductase [Mycobacterium riyadhense]|nr:NAD(P)/FAD-dependent oxidoreductase [Mycobacterium riyadhense]